MTKFIQNSRQVLLGLFSIMLGIFVYIAFRPSWQTACIPEITYLNWSKFQYLTERMYNLPSFLHIFGFSLLTAGVVSQKKWTFLIICGSWLFVNLLFEFLQTNATYNWLHDISINHENLNPILHWFQSYSLHGIFDPKDILALFSGAMLAYVFMVKTNKGD